MTVNWGCWNSNWDVWNESWSRRIHRKVVSWFQPLNVNAHGEVRQLHLKNVFTSLEYRVRPIVGWCERLLDHVCSHKHMRRSPEVFRDKNVAGDEV